MDVGDYYPRGAANPLRYVHCQPAATADEPSLAVLRSAPAPPRAAPSAESLRTITERLGDEPLFHLMLAHRELFHTNLLAWFFEHLAHIGDRAVAELSPADENQHERRVRREWKHLDLVVETPGRAPLVVDNKIFALPDETAADRLRRMVDVMAGELHLHSAQHHLTELAE